MMADLVKRAELLDRIRSARARLEEALARLDEAQMVRPGAQNGWSVKDILAHITSWEQYLLAWIDAAARGAMPPLPVPAGDEEVDRLNAQTFDRNRSRPLRDVLEDFQRSYRQVLSAVDGIASDEQLHLPLPRAWANRVPLWQVIAVNTYEHYDEHLEAIRSWAAGSPDAATS